jgi:hypothetical protein
MALVRKSRTTTSNVAASSDSWKAAAFLNINLVGKTNVKLGAIPLRESNASESKIISWIAGDAVKAATLKDKFILSYNSVAEAASTGLDFLDDIEIQLNTPEETGVIGYLNFALPTATGSARLGTVVLKDGNAVHERLDVWLADETNLEVLKDKMNVVYQSATSKAQDFLLD